MLIILTISRDYSCDRLQEWLVYYDKPAKRYCLDQMNFPEFKLPIDDKSIIYSRKFSLPVPAEKSLMHKYLYKELRAYWYEFFESANKEQFIGTGKFEEPSRILMLKKASESGYSIPAYLLTTQKSELLKFLDNGFRVITKPLSAPHNIIEGQNDMAFRASLIEEEDVAHLEENFYPTFFQQCIKREVEVRMFFFHDKFWAMAFVVKDEDHTTDIWNVKIRREVPIRVPQNVLESTRKFKAITGFKTGSIDFIINDGIWYFLEINPNGQYDFLIKSCNYQIDREIAKNVI
ncbi:MAG: hypothetical protein P1U56_02555 [Saprospiraceae bacterium]|nr:hypothetical protein [Saprospiraceae bacterium]